MRGSCSWSCWAPEPREQREAGEQTDGEDGPGEGQAQGPCTSFTRGLKLCGATILPIASYRAGTDLDHITGIGPQSIQLHRVLLAGHGGGNALTLQCTEEGGILR
jgi:hypothetical protein